jgi:hypothetical protein
VPLPLFCGFGASAVRPSAIVIDFGTSGPPKKKMIRAVMCTTGERRPSRSHSSFECFN